jgi:hypothetical protein
MIRKYLSILILILFIMLCGCQSLPDTKLGNCEDFNYDVFTRNFQLDIPDPLQYRYTLRWRSKTLIANGITHKTDKSRVNVAGFSNLGMTLYSAQWQDDHFEILKNNTGMPDKFLKRSILSDMLLLYRQLPPAGNCIRQDALDGSLWLETNRQLAGGKGYFVVLEGQPAWGSVRNGKICFKAVVAQKNGNTPKKITIENFNEGYKSEIRFVNEGPAK